MAYPTIPLPPLSDAVIVIVLFVFVHSVGANAEFIIGAVLSIFVTVKDATLVISAPCPLLSMLLA